MEHKNEDKVEEVREINEKSGRGMINNFTDSDLTNDYDQAIYDTRKVMRNCNPCQSAQEMDSLIVRLKQYKDTYYSRPCVEGYCFGFFTPHKSRIERRISAFQGESSIHNRDCQDYTREKEFIENNRTQLEIRKAELQHEEEIKKHEINAMKEATLIITSEQKGIHSKRFGN